VTGHSGDERHGPQPFPGLGGPPAAAPQYLPDPSTYAPYAPPVAAATHVDSYAGHALAAAPVAELPAPSAHAAPAPYAPPADDAAPVRYPAPESYAPPASYAEPVAYAAPATHAEPVAYAAPAAYAEPVPYAPPASYAPAEAAPTTYLPAAAPVVAPSHPVAPEAHVPAAPQSDGPVPAHLLAGPAVTVVEPLTTQLPPLPTAPARRPDVRAGVAARGRGRGRGDVAITAGGVGLGISLGIAVYSVKDGLDLPGGKLLALGTIAAMTGTYLCLVLLLLVARIPWIEREIGQDRLVALHRKVAPYSLFLIAGHVVLTTVSYAQAEDHSVLGQLWALVTKSAWMVPAATAFVLMVGLGVISYKKIRSRMNYETWWVAHLYFYLAVALAFGHQVELGVMFQAHPYQKYFWTALYLFVFGTILVTRFVIPISFSRKHQLRVAAIVPEGDGVVSVYISGVDLDLVKARGGQFFQWRFVTRDWWWQAHPYSLSASPNPSWLRITVKDLGDQSSRLHRLRVGTRVLAEGPYGVFTAAARHGDSIAAFAAGVGITPIRAVLDDLPDGTSVTLVYRVAQRDTAPLREELEALVTERGWRMHYLQGSRHHHPLTAEYLSRLVPGLAASDVFVCGPTSFTDRIVESVRAAGVPDERVHHEAFSF
jgi:predicted ferric reductase